MAIDENPFAAVLYAVITSCLLYSLADYVLYASAALAASAVAFLTYRYCRYCLLTFFAWCGRWCKFLNNSITSIHAEGVVLCMPGAYPVILSFMDLPCYARCVSEEMLELQRRNDVLEETFDNLKEESWNSSQDWARTAAKMMADHKDELEMAAKALVDKEASWQQKYKIRDLADANVLWEEKLDAQEKAYNLRIKALKGRLQVQAPLRPTPTYTLVPTAKVEVDALRDLEITKLKRRAEQDARRENALRDQEIVNLKNELQQAKQQANSETTPRDLEITKLKEQAEQKASRENALRDQEIADLRTRFENAKKQTVDKTALQLKDLQAKNQEISTVAANRLKENKTKQAEAKQNAELAANALSGKDAALESMRDELTAANQKLAASETRAFIEELTAVKKKLADSEQLNKQYVEAAQAFAKGARREFQQAEAEAQTTLETTQNEYQQYVASIATREQDLNKALTAEKDGAAAREKVLAEGGQALEKKHHDLKEKFDKVEKERDGLKEENEGLQLDVDLWQAQCEDTNSELDGLQKQKDELKKECNDLQTENHSLKNKCNDLPTDDQSMKKKYISLQAESDYLSGQRQNLEEALFKTNQLVTQLTNKLSTAQNDLGKAQVELENIKRSGTVGSSGDLQKKLEESNFKLGTSAHELAEANAALDELKKSRLGVVKAQLDQLKAEQKSLRGVKEALRAEVNALVIKNDNLEKAVDEKDKKIKDMELFG